MTPGRPVTRPTLRQTFLGGLAAGLVPFLDALGGMSSGDLVFRLFMLPVLAGCLLALLQAAAGLWAGRQLGRPRLMAWGRESTAAGRAWGRRLMARRRWLFVLPVFLLAAGGAWWQAGQSRGELTALFARHAQGGPPGWRLNLLTTYAPLLNPWLGSRDRTEVTAQVAQATTSPGFLGSYRAAQYLAYLETAAPLDLETALTGQDVTMFLVDGRPLIANPGLHPTDRKAKRLKLSPGGHALEIRYFTPVGRAYLTAELPAELARLLRPLAAAAPRQQIWLLTGAVERWTRLAWLLAVGSVVLFLWLLAPYPELAPPRPLTLLRRRWPEIALLLVTGGSIFWRLLEAGAGHGSHGWLALAGFMDWSGVLPPLTDTWSPAVSVGYALWAALAVLPPGPWLAPLAVAVLAVGGLLLGGLALERLAGGRRLSTAALVTGLCPWLIVAASRPDPLLFWALPLGGLALWTLGLGRPWGVWCAAVVLGVACSLSPGFAPLALAAALCYPIIDRVEWRSPSFWLTPLAFLAAAYPGARTWLSGLGCDALQAVGPADLWTLQGLARDWTAALPVGLYLACAIAASVILFINRINLPRRLLILPTASLLALAASWVLFSRFTPSGILAAWLPLGFWLALALPSPPWGKDTPSVARRALSLAFGLAALGSLVLLP